MKIIRIIKGWVDKKIFRIKLWEMDDWWHYTRASSWELLPLSFYYTYTEKKIECITAEIKERMQVLMKATLNGL